MSDGDGRPMNPPDWTSPRFPPAADGSSGVGDVRRGVPSTPRRAIADEDWAEVDTWIGPFHRRRLGDGSVLTVWQLTSSRRWAWTHVDDDGSADGPRLLAAGPADYPTPDAAMTGADTYVTGGSMTEDQDALPEWVARYDLPDGPSFRWIEETHGQRVAVEVQWLAERGLWTRSIGPPAPPGTPATPGAIPQPMPEQWEYPTPKVPPEAIVARRLRAAAEMGGPAGETL